MSPRVIMSNREVDQKENGNMCWFWTSDLCGWKLGIVLDGLKNTSPPIRTKPLPLTPQALSAPSCVIQSIGYCFFTVLRLHLHALSTCICLRHWSKMDHKVYTLLLMYVSPVILWLIATTADWLLRPWWMILLGCCFMHLGDSGHGPLPFPLRG